VTVVNGHDHVADITYRLVQSGVRTFNLLQNAGHSHSFTLTENQAAMLNLGFPVVVESSVTDYHTHTITIQKQE